MTHTTKNTAADRNTYSITVTALFTALTCISTMLIQIPSPANGYVNLGDCFVLLSAFLLGPVLGAAAAGTGSMLADIFSGYTYYAPGTFIIKALMAVCAYFLYRLVWRFVKKHKVIAALTAAAFAEIIMISGYFVFAAFFLGLGLGATADIPGNVVQAVFALIVTPLLFTLISRNRSIKFYR